MREGEELKAPRHASAAAVRDDHVTIYNIVPIVIKQYFKLLKAYLHLAVYLNFTFFLIRFTNS